MPKSKEITVRLEKGGERFEIVVDADKAFKFRRGQGDLSVQDVILAPYIFRDVRKGERASIEKIRELFGSEDKAFEEILRKGEMQLTEEQRREMREEILNKIVAILARETIDPRTKLPHPPDRIRRAIDEAGVSIDLSKPPEAQVRDVAKKLMRVLPLKFERMVVAVKIPAEYVARAYGYLKKHEITKEEWGKDGSYIALVRIPSGVQAEFFEKLANLTKGQVQTRIVERG